MGTTRITAPAGLPFIEMERTVDAPSALVYRAHTDPALLVQWLGPRRYEMRIDRFEVRDGGTWRYVHVDGAREHGFHGVFHGTPSVEGGIVQTFEYEGAPGHVSLDRLTLEEHDGQTTIRVHSTFEAVADRDAMIANGMEHGVEDGYARLDELVARTRTAG